MTEIRTLEQHALDLAREGSYYTTMGPSAGGEHRSFADSYEKALAEQDIGKPLFWVVTSGAAVNAFSASYAPAELDPTHLFRPELVFLMFPLDGLDLRKLMRFKLDVIHDQFFDQIVDHMPLVPLRRVT